MNEENEVLLGKRAITEEVFPGFRAMPGGKVELDGTQNEQNILEENLRKEFLEEVGIEIGNICYLNSHYGYNQNEFKIYIVFTANIIGGKLEALEETDEVGFYSIQDALTLQLTPNIDKILIQVNKSFLS